MEYLSIQNFRYGLDARRSVMASQPGVLARCDNAHINSGAEIEKRKAFLRAANLFPSNTFGVEVTDTGLMTFGSDAAPNAALPAGVTYQRLLPPAEYIPETSTADTMLGVVFSCNFKGKAFVLAEFSNGVFAYYDGTLVPASRNGKVLERQIGGGETLAQLGAELAAQINALEGWNATAAGGVVTVKSPPGVYFDLVVGKDTVAGTLSVSFVDKDGGTAGRAASASFKVTNAGGVGATFTLQVGVGVLPITENPVPGIPGNINGTAASIATAINNYTHVSGYHATSNADEVQVIAPLELGNVTFNLTVTTTGTADTGAATGSGPMDITVDPIYVSASKRENLRALSGGAWVYSPAVTVSAQGGTGPYTFAWIMCNPDGSTPPDVDSGITPTKPTNAVSSFHKYMTSRTSAIGHFKCLVTDSLIVPAYSQVVTVKLTLTP